MQRTRSVQTGLFLAAFITLVIAAAPAHAQERQDVAFSVSQTTTVGQSIFVLGDLPELGASDIRKAVKLEPFTYPVWKATISLPTNRAYTYRFYRRDDGPGRGGDATNGVAVSAVFSSATASAALVPTAKTLFYHSGFAQPVVNWRLQGSGGAYATVAMQRYGRARSAAESRWVATNFATPRRAMEFFFTNGGGAGRDPAGSAVYTTSLDAALIQDGQFYTYVPAASVSAARRNYTTSALPSISSTNLGQNRAYRVWLPRGYNEHTSRAYPVLYLHDGNNVFEAGPFGTWNADTTAASLMNTGQMREVILVGVDNTGTRLADYSATENGSGARADRYIAFLRDELMPVVNGQYRTLPGASTTGTLGSSMGGQVSLYAAWDFASTFTRIGAMSGAFQISGSGGSSSVFYNRVQSQPKRAIRLYMDSGDAGPATDNYWPILNLRDNFINPARAGGGPGVSSALEGDLRHAVGQGHQHNEAAWAARLPLAYTFLYPASEDQRDLLSLFGPAFDVSGDGSVGIDDAYAQAAVASDVNSSGAADGQDASDLERYNRREEALRMAGGQR
ncbi:MAG: alpha/beta hydrolase-fold protein [Phycisphaerales bacterium]